MKRKLDKEILANISLWVLLLAIFSSLIGQWIPITGTIGLSLGTVLPLVGVAYFNALFIIPRFLKKRRFGWYFLTIMLLLFAVTSLNIGLTNILVNDLGFEQSPFQNRPTSPNRMSGAQYRVVPLFFLTIATLFISTIYKLAKEFLKKEQRNTHLEKEKIKHELNFLRSQINPHFLFNALNNLHATVQLKPEKAGDYILKLGGMLRYVLEDCKKDKVSLVEEINYIQNYIFFQKQKDEDFQNIQFEINGDEPSTLHLEPMLLIALVENAFQHSYSENAENQHIVITVHLKKRRLQFTTRNNLRDENDIPNSEKRNSFGVGLQNIKRRLELQYPQSHTFTHGIQNNEYQTTLIIHPSPL